jgi:urea transporter
MLPPCSQVTLQSGGRLSLEFFIKMFISAHGVIIGFGAAVFQNLCMQRINVNAQIFNRLRDGLI